MAFGFSTTNTFGDAVIDQDFSNVAMIYQIAGNISVDYGNPFNNTYTNMEIIIDIISPSYYIYSDTPYEQPLFFVKPSQPDKYFSGIRQMFYNVGTTIYSANGVTIVAQTGHSYYHMYAECNVSIAMFWGTKGTPIQDSGNYGMQVFRSNGTDVAFDSRRYYPSITEMIYKPQNTNMTDAGNVGYPYTYTLSGYSEMPWVGVNELYSSLPMSAGASNDVQVVRINSTFTQLTIHKIIPWTGLTYIDALVDHTTALFTLLGKPFYITLGYIK